MSLSTTMTHLTATNGWSRAVENMLHQLVGDGFAFHICGRLCDPVAVVASYPWQHHVDLLTITGANRVTAARAVREPGFDVFAPGPVVWAYGNEAEPTLRALLDLKHPDHPEHPVATTTPPRLMTVPAHLQRPLTFKPPASWKAGNRARRLTAALARELAIRELAGVLDRETRDHALKTSSLLLLKGDHVSDVWCSVCGCEDCICGPEEQDKNPEPQKKNS